MWWARAPITPLTTTSKFVPARWQSRGGGVTLVECRPRYRGDVNQLAAIILVVLLAVPLVIVGVMFVWAAIRDGEEDRALQRRLGIRRRTRLGR